MSGEDFPNQFLNNIEQLQRFVKQEADSLEQQLFTLHSKFLWNQVNIKQWKYRFILIIGKLN